MRGMPAKAVLMELKRYRRAEELCWVKEDPEEKFAQLRHEFRLVRMVVKDGDGSYCWYLNSVPSPFTYHD